MSTAARAPVTRARSGACHANRHQVTREGTAPGASSTTREQKAALIKGASELLRDVLGKPMESTFVVIEEVDTHNWGWGGVPALEYRKKLAASRAAPPTSAT